MLGKLQLGLASVLVIGGALASSVDCVIAQIVPDATLGTESSVVTPQAPGSNVDLIQGGATRGANLFHSFEQFSVLTGREAFFNNATDIQNIISRVTGSSISNIDGLIQANGTANLFLLNPNGITFGSNASLAIGGSFLGSTASSVNFADGNIFSATAPQPTPLLTVSLPVGLQFGGTKGSIAQFRGTNSSGIGVLQVPQGKTLVLVGGDVGLDSGTLLAPGGRVELAGVAEPAMVGLNIDSNNLSLSFPEGVRLSDVSFNRAVVDVSSSSSGSIAVTARNINVLGESVLRANIQPDSDSVNAQARDITLNTTEGTAIVNSLIENLVLPGSVGDGGNINITSTAGSVSVTDGTEISVSSGETGNAGNITIEANELLLDNEGSLQASSVIFGEGGNINLQVRDLILMRNQSLISATSGGWGNGANILIGNPTLEYAPFVVAVPDENSDIIAQSPQGRGGEIYIFTQGIIGFEVLNSTNPQTSEITASGALGILNIEIAPIQGLEALPSELVDASNQIDTSCAAGAGSVAKNEFIITGRGGLPPSPTEPLNGEAVLTEWATLKSDVENRSDAPYPNFTREPAPTTIVEAQKWAIAPNGEVILTASAPTVTPSSSRLIPMSCNGS